MNDIDCEKFTGLRRYLCLGELPSPDGGFVKITDNRRDRFRASLEGSAVPPLNFDKGAINTAAFNSTPVGGVGSELEKMFSAAKIPACSSCRELRKKLDSWGIDACEQNIPTISAELEANARRRPLLKRLVGKWSARVLIEQAIHNARLRSTGQRVPSGIMANVISGVSRAARDIWAGNLSAKSSHDSSVTWSYGVTTVPSRINTYLPITLRSLRTSGFVTPHLFVDGGTDYASYETFNLPLTFRSFSVRTFGNWISALWELYSLNPSADRYAIFQDDFICCRGLKEYLSECPWPVDGYLNLYTFPQNHDKIKSKGTGWHKSNQQGLGAVALVFDKETISALLSSVYLVRRVQNKGRGHKSIDGGIVTALNRVGRFEYVHNPSLVQHIGRLSSMNNGRHPESPSFPGEEFDSTSFIERVSK